MSDTERLCQGCQIDIPSGDPFYMCKTEFVSGFDSILPESKDPESDIEEALQQLKGLSAKEAMDEVYEKIELVLCPICRTKLQKTILAILPNRKPPRPFKAATPMKPRKSSKSKGKILPFPRPADTD